MTLDAVKLSEHDVGLMSEFDVVRNIVDLDPGYRCIRIIMLFFFHDLRVHGDDVFVAEEAFLHGRYPGMIGPSDKGVAEAAIDLLDPGMDPMTEINGLLRTND